MTGRPETGVAGGLQRMLDSSVSHPPTKSGGLPEAPRLASLAQPGTLRLCAAGALGVLLWVATVIETISPWQPPSILLPSIVGVALILVMPDFNASLRLPLVICLVMLATMIWKSGDPSPLIAGLRFVAPLAAFMIATGLLRNSLMEGARGTVSRANLEDLSPAERQSAMLLLGFALGSVFLFAAITMLAPLARTQDRIQSARLGAAALCGCALAFAWSPFTVGMTFASGVAGIHAGPQVIGVMLVLALIGLAMALVIHGSAGLRALVMTANVVRPLVLPLALAMSLGLLTATLFAISMIRAVILVAPPLALLFWALGSRDGKTCSISSKGLLANAGTMLKDLGMYAVGFALTVAITNSDLQAISLAAATGLGSAALAPVALLGLSLLLAVSGAPALVAAGIVGGAAIPILSSLGPLAALAATLFAWSAASMLSVTSVALNVATSSFATPIRTLVLGRNLGVMALHGTVLALMAGLTLFFQI